MYTQYSTYNKYQRWARTTFCLLTIAIPDCEGRTSAIASPYCLKMCHSPITSPLCEGDTFFIFSSTMTRKLEIRILNLNEKLYARRHNLLSPQSCVSWPNCTFLKNSYEEMHVHLPEISQIISFYRSKYQHN